MSMLKDALDVVDRNSLDCSDLLFNSERDSFICIDCQESTNKEQLAHHFEAKWNEFVNHYMNAIYEVYPEEEYEYEDTPEGIGLDIQIEENKVVVNLYVGEFRVYGHDIPDFLDFGEAVAEFLEEFFSNPDYKECTYESVLMIAQDFGVCVSGGIELYSNVEDNEFDYSFDRLLPMMLQELQRQWDECDADEAEDYLNEMMKCSWIPDEWYGELAETTDDHEKLEILISMVP